MRLTVTQPRGVTIKSSKELELMSQAGAVVARTKVRLMEAIAPSVTTRELDRVAEGEIRGLGAIPSFKGYMGVASTPFPASICVSLNEEIVHGIPSDRMLREGDIVSVDVGAIVGGFHGDSAFTVGVGEISAEVQRLIDSTRESLRRAIAQARAGARVGRHLRGGSGICGGPRILGRTTVCRTRHRPCVA